LECKLKETRISLGKITLMIKFGKIQNKKSAREIVE